MTTPINYNLIKDEQLRNAVENSGIYEAKNEGVNYIYNDKIYNVALSYQAADDTTEKVESLFVRIMGESEFYLGVYDKDNQHVIDEVLRQRDTDFDLAECLANKSENPAPQFTGTLSQDFQELFEDLCPSLMPKVTELQVTEFEEKTELPSTKTEKKVELISTKTKKKVELPSTKTEKKVDLSSTKKSGDLPKNEGWSWRALAIAGVALLAIAFVGYKIQQTYWNSSQA